jgi:hypothetical protein
MHLWDRARAAFGYVASVCSTIKLGSEGREARHKNLKLFSHKVWVLSLIRMLEGGTPAVKDVPRECGIQGSWPIIVGPVLGKIERQSIDRGIKFSSKYERHLCNLYGRLMFSLYAKIKLLSARMVNDVKISILD